MNTSEKARYARLHPEPYPLAAILYRIMRLTMLPPPPAGAVAQLRLPLAPATDFAIAQTAVATVRPGGRT